MRHSHQIIRFNRVSITFQDKKKYKNWRILELISMFRHFKMLVFVFSAPLSAVHWTGYSRPYCQYGWLVATRVPYENPMDILYTIAYVIHARMGTSDNLTKTQNSPNEFRIDRKCSIKEWFWRGLSFTRSRIMIEKAEFRSTNRDAILTGFHHYKQCYLWLLASMCYEDAYDRTLNLAGRDGQIMLFYNLNNFVEEI